MSDVRHKEGVPTASDFADFDGGPLIVDTTNGNLYMIDGAGNVILVGGTTEGDYPAPLGHAMI